MAPAPRAPADERSRGRASPLQASWLGQVARMDKHVRRSVSASCGLRDHDRLRRMESRSAAHGAGRTPPGRTRPAPRRAYALPGSAAGGGACTRRLPRRPLPHLPPTRPSAQPAPCVGSRGRNTPAVSRNSLPQRSGVTRGIGNALACSPAAFCVGPLLPTWLRREGWRGGLQS
jgi:hypothetical protein